MGFDKPQDLVWMLIIFASIMVTVGLGIDMVSTEYGVDVSDGIEIYDGIESRVNGSSTKGLKGASDAQVGILSGETDSSADQSSRDSFILTGFQSLRQLGNAWNAVQVSIDESWSYLGIPTIYITMVTAGLLITFAAVLYSWLRGN